MRSRVFAAFLVAGMAGASGACSSDAPSPTEPTAITVPVQLQTSMHAGDAHNHRTHLTGDAERPVPNDSQAQGQAIFQVSDDGSEIQYKLVVANIQNVTQAHIHCCANTDGTAGIVVWLYPSAPPQQLIPGRFQGALADGTITQASLVGSLAGQSLSVLLGNIASGLAYVNVHTSQFPPGEIRGQIQ
jgi:CHRD domain